MINGKSQLRKIMIDRRLSLPAEACTLAGHRVCEKLMQWECYKAADIILGYYPCRNELDIRPLLLDALDKGKKMAFPKVLGPRRMVFLNVQSLEELKPGYMNIPEPQLPPDRPGPQYLPLFPDAAGGTFPEGARMLILVPGTAFCSLAEADRSGPIGRMGYGGGYYDNFLHLLGNRPEVTTCGIAYGFQVVSPDVLPMEEHDVLLDRLVYDDIY